MTDRTLNLGTKFSANVDPLLQGIKQIRTALKGYAQMSSTVGRQTTQLNKGLATVGTTSAKATAPTRRLATAHAVLGKQISGVSGGFERLKAAMKVTASYGVAATLIFAFTKALRFGADEIINFDQGLKNLEAITGANNAQLAAMSDVMLELARDTKFSATEISEGMVLLGQAGFTAEESLNAIKATSQLATGTLTSMQTTADLLTTTIRAFNMESIEAGRVADVFANAVNKSKLTVDKLRVAFNFVGAAASQAGLSLEQTAASAMVLANSGLRASTIGTGLRQVLAKLIAPSEKLRESFAAHNIDLSKVNAQGFNFRKTLEYLAPLLIDHKTGMVDMAKAYELFKLRGAQAAAILIRGFSSGKFDEAIRKVNEVGTAAAMAAIQQEGLAVKWKNLSDSAGALAQALGEAGVAGAMGGFIDTMKALITVVEKFVRSGFGVVTLQTIALTTAIVGLSKAIGFLEGVALTRLVRKLHLLNVLTGAGTLRASIGLLVKSFGGWNLVLLGVAAAIGLVVASINRFMGHNKRMAEEHDKLATAAAGAAQGLNMYRKVLEDLHTKKDKDSAEQYLATVKRLVAEYKELGSVTENMALSHEDFMAKVESAENTKFSTNMKEALNTAIAYKKVQDDLIKQNSDLNRLGTSGFRQSNEDIKQLDELKKRRIAEAKLIPKVAEAIDNSASANKRLIDTLLDLAYYGKVNMEQSEDWIEVMHRQGLLVGTLEENIKQFQTSLTNLRQDYKDFGVFSDTMIEKMPEQMKAIYESLSTAGKIDFLKDAKALQSRIAGVTKVLADFGIVGDDVNEIVEHLEEAFLKLQRSLVTPLEGANWSPRGYAGERDRGSGMEGIKEAEAEIDEKIEKAKALKEEAKEAEIAYRKLLDEIFSTNRTSPGGYAGERDRGSGMEGIEEAEKEIDERRKAAAREIKRLAEETAAAYEFQRTTLGAMSPEIREIYNGLSDVAKMEFIDEFASLESSLIDINKQMTQLGFTSAEVEAVIKQMRDDFATLRSQNAWGGMVMGLRDYTEEIRYSARTWRDFTVDALTGMEGSFSNFFDEVLNDADSFSDMLKSLWKNMTAALSRSFADALAQMVMKAGVSGFGSLFGNAAAAGTGYGTTLLGGQTAGYKAAGGPVSAGRAYIVGEKGKELFVPNDNGRILPNGGGEASVNVVVNNNSSEQATVTESRGPDNSRQVFVTIGTDIARGGPIAGAIERTYGLRRKGRIV